MSQSFNFEMLKTSTGHPTYVISNLLRGYECDIKFDFLWFQLVKFLQNQEHGVMLFNRLFHCSFRWGGSAEKGQSGASDFVRKHAWEAELRHLD